MIADLLIPVFTILIMARRFDAVLDLIGWYEKHLIKIQSGPEWEELQKLKVTIAGKTEAKITGKGGDA